MRTYVCVWVKCGKGCMAVGGPASMHGKCVLSSLLSIKSTIKWGGGELQVEINEKCFIKLSVYSQWV